MKDLREVRRLTFVCDVHDAVEAGGEAGVERRDVRRRVHPRARASAQEKWRLVRPCCKDADRAVGLDGYALSEWDRKADMTFVQLDSPITAPTGLRNESANNIFELAGIDALTTLWHMHIKRL